MTFLNLDQVCPNGTLILNPLFISTRMSIQLSTRSILKVLINEVIITGYDGIGHPSVTDRFSILYQRKHAHTGKKVLVLRPSDQTEIILTDSMFNSTDGVHHPRDTMVAFAMENEEGNLDIYSLNYQTQRIKRLTFSKSYDFSPHWSPDGTQLIFTSHREGPPKIYKMDSDGSNIMKLTPGPKEEFSAAWSPDGLSIVFSSRDAKSPNGQDPMVKHNSSDLFILSLRTNEVTQITDNEDMEVLPDWSPDGNFITYTSCATGHREIYVLDINSGKTKRLTFSKYLKSFYSKIKVYQVNTSGPLLAGRGHSLTGS